MVEKKDYGVTLSVYSFPSLDYPSFQAETLKSNRSLGKKNAYSFVRSILISNHTDEDIEDAHLSFRCFPDWLSIPDMRVGYIEKGRRDTSIEGVRLSIDPLPLFSVSEKINGSIVATLTSKEGKMLATNSTEFSILPIDKALVASPSPILASFVMPNSPSLNDIEKGIVDMLVSEGYSPSLKGYEDDDSLIMKELEIAYKVIQSKHIKIIAYGNAIERRMRGTVQTPEETLSYLSASELDMAILLASVYERIGFHTVLVATSNGAMVGVWLSKDRHLNRLFEDNAQSILNPTSKSYGEMLLIPASSLFAVNEEPFQKAVLRAPISLSQDSSFRYAIDIMLARENLLLPLPSKGNVDLSFLDPNEVEEEISIQRREEIEYDNEKKDRYSNWEDKLLDLSLGNNLIKMPFSSSSICICLKDIEKYISFLGDNEKISILPIENKPSLDSVKEPYLSSSAISESLERGYREKKIFAFSHGKDFYAGLTNLYRKMKASIEQSGCNPLFLTLGLIRWEDAGEVMNAPLLLLPVRLVRKSKESFVLEYSFDELTFNRTFAEYARINFGLNLDKLVKLASVKDGNLDFLALSKAVRESISSMKDWLLFDEVSYLSLFSYAHFAMWNDLRKNKDSFSSHPIIDGFINGSFEHVELNDTFDGRAIYPLRADSSQKEAINAALSGKSFVLDGPPGTGKSQTIANIISNCLNLGKKVLFVAEKEVALDVVKKRLDDISLGQFTMKLSSSEESKKEVLSSYDKLVSEGMANKPNGLTDLHKNLTDKEEEISAKLSKLHDRGTYPFSPYEAINIYLETKDASRLPLSESYVKGLSFDGYQNTLVSLSSLEDSLTSFGGYGSSSLLPYQNREYSPFERDALKDELDAFQKRMKSASIAVTNAFKGLKSLPTTKENILLFAKAISLLRDKTSFWNEFFLEDMDEGYLSEIRTALKLKIRYLQAKEEILFSYDDDVLSIDGKSLYEESIYLASLSSFKRLFVKKDLTKKAQKYRRDKKKLSFDEYKDLAKSLTKLLSLRKDLEAADLRMRSIFDKHYFATSIEGQEILNQFEKTVLFNNLISSFNGDQDEIKPFFISLGQGSIFNKTNSVFLDFVSEYESKGKELLDKYSFDIALYPDSNRYFEVLSNSLQLFISSIGRLSEWTALLKKIDEISSDMNGEFLLDYLSEGRNDSLSSSYRHSLSSKIIELSFQEFGLYSINSEDEDRRIAEYKELLSRLEEMDVAEAAYSISKDFPSSEDGRFAKSTDMAKISKLASKAGRGVSLRSFFTSFPELLMKLTPAFMASPAAVAKYLDPSLYHFDLVIFDEASQIPTSESIGAIARADSMIVAGDPKQMPPTTFFVADISGKEINDIDDYLNEDLESLLDDAIALGLPERRLTWHYRSKHEPLIAFSNDKFYEDSLLTFPAPKGDDSCIEYRKVKSSYKKGRGVNETEANAVVKEIISRLNDEEKRQHSIGVITFNEPQQNLIDDLLDKELSKKRSLANIEPGGLPIFIKNLENAQGDERDIILFSTTYGEDQYGDLSINFGPLSLAKGERRLNVAITRAKEKLIVFSSLDPADIDASKAKNEGASYLKDFLNYAKYGSDSLPIKSSYRRSKEEFISLLAEDLRSSGYHIETNLGESDYHIDIAIALPSTPNNYILGVMCDNDKVSSMDFQDRFLNGPDVLRSLGWRIENVYSVEYFDHKDEVLKRIIHRINDPQGNNGVFTDKIRKINVSKSSSTAISNSLPYLKYVSPIRYEFPNGLEKIVTEIINTESPISEKLLFTRVREVYGLERIGSKMQNALEWAIRYATCYNGISLYLEGTEKYYVSSSFDEVSYSTYRHISGDEDIRSINDVSFIEISNCLRDILRRQGQMDIEDLAKESATALGYATLSLTARKRLMKAIRWADCRRNGIMVRGESVSLNR